MSWAALLLAGAVLGQVPSLPGGLQDAPLAPLSPLAPQVGGGDDARAGMGQVPLGANEGTYGGQSGGQASPAPGEWGPSVVGSAASPAGAGGTPPVAESPQTPQLPNWFGRLGHLEDLKREKDAANAAAVPAAETPYGASQSPKPAPPSSVAPATAQPSAAQMAVVRHLTPEKMLEEAMTLPPSSVVAGRRVTLVDVLGQVTSRAKRVEIAHAYWQLARKLGEYRFCWEESQQIQAIGLHRLDANLLASAQQAADRELTAAELALLQSQYHLAEVADLDSSGKLPLPGDSFHLGTYNTHFEKIFVNRSSPGQTRLIHRTLPLQHRVIDVPYGGGSCRPGCACRGCPIVRGSAGGCGGRACCIARNHGSTAERGLRPLLGTITRLPTTRWPLPDQRQRDAIWFPF